MNRIIEITRRTAGLVEQEYFRGVVEAFREVLGVDNALVSQLVGGRLETLCFWGEEGQDDAFECPSRATPCEEVLANGPTYYPQDVLASFPGDPRLTALRAEAYLGVPIRMADGTTIGVMAVIHSARLPNYEETRAALDLCAVRAGAELLRMQVERERARARSLETLGLLAGGIAHDFNNILMGILGNTQDARLVEGIPAEAVEALDAVLAAGETGRVIASQILASLGRRSVEAETLSLAEIARNSVELNRVRAREAGVRLECDVGMGAQVMGDRAEISQLLLNLVVNAIQATHASGTVRVEVDASETHAEMPPPSGSFTTGPVPAGKHVHLRVRDTGVGMDAETLQKVFTAFYTTKRGGRGLGLSVVHGVVQAHGGSLSVVSAPGEGTCFDIYFPRVDASSFRSPRPKSVVGAVRPGQRVLVVEDNAQVGRACVRMLQRLGFAAELALDGVEAKELLAQRDHAVLLCDLTLGAEDGITLADELVAARPGLLRIFMSGYLTPDDEARIGDHPFLQKPFDRKALRAALSPTSS